MVTTAISAPVAPRRRSMRDSSSDAVGWSMTPAEIVDVPNRLRRDQRIQPAVLRP